MTGAETAKTVFVVEARTEVVEDRTGVSTALATILEEVRRHMRRLVPLLPEKSCMIAVLEVRSQYGRARESVRGLGYLYWSYSCGVLF